MQANASLCVRIDLWLQETHINSPARIRLRRSINVAVVPREQRYWHLLRWLSGGFPRLGEGLREEAMALVLRLES